MRVLARWSIVLTLLSASVFAAAQPAWLHAASRLAYAPTADVDVTENAGGLQSQSTPRDHSQIGPGAGAGGTTGVKALVSAPAMLSWLQTERVQSVRLPALTPVRPSQHLRSIPLLI